MLGKRNRRVLPADVAAASSPSAPVPAAADGVSWLEPFPDRLLDLPGGASEAEEALLRSYMAAHDKNDQAALADLLVEDVRVSFPPTSLWYDGRDGFIVGSRSTLRWASTTSSPPAPTRNRSSRSISNAPAVRRSARWCWRFLTVAGGRIIAIVDYDLPGLFVAFGLPEEL